MTSTPDTEATPRCGLSADEICGQMLPHYALPPSLRCRFLMWGMHDNYLVESPTEKYVLRVYRSRWRSRDEILFELELLAHLHRRSCPVAYPLFTTASEPLVPVQTADGERLAALFAYAPGHAPARAIEPRHAETLGQVIARIHHEADTFSTAHTRQVLDLDYLLDDSVGAISPYLTREQRQTVQATQRRIRDTLPALSRQTPAFGPCSGDVNPRNFHVDDRGHITVFDFDQCGLGWRAFEIGKFYSTLPADTNAEALRAAFLRGYESVRALEPDERRAIPQFVTVSYIWVMALHVYNADLVGQLLADPRFWIRKLEGLRRLENA